MEDGGLRIEGWRSGGIGGLFGGVGRVRFGMWNGR